MRCSNITTTGATFRLYSETKSTADLVKSGKCIVGLVVAAESVTFSGRTKLKLQREHDLDLPAHKICVGLILPTFPFFHQLSYFVPPSLLPYLIPSTPLFIFSSNSLPLSPPYFPI